MQVSQQTSFKVVRNNFVELLSSSRWEMNLNEGLTNICLITEYTDVCIQAINCQNTWNIKAVEYLAILKYAYHIQVIFIIEVDFYGLACLSLNANKFLQGPRNSSKVIRFGSFSAGLFLGFAWKWNFHRWAKLMNFNKGFCPSVGRPFSPVHYIVFAPLSSDKLNALTLPKKLRFCSICSLLHPFV